MRAAARMQCFGWDRDENAGAMLPAAPEPTRTYVVDEIASQPCADIHAVAAITIDGKDRFDPLANPDLDGSGLRQPVVHVWAVLQNLLI